MLNAHEDVEHERYNELNFGTRKSKTLHDLGSKFKSY